MLQGIIANNIKDSFIDIKKGGYPVGTVRNGYKKVADTGGKGDWIKDGAAEATIKKEIKFTVTDVTPSFDLPEKSKEGKFIAKLLHSDYNHLHTYSSLDQVQEVVRGHVGVSVKEMPLIIQLKDEPKSNYYIKRNDKFSKNIMVDYKIRKEESGFALYELKLNKYNEYENEEEN
jgi:hypothetical protein